MDEVVYEPIIGLEVHAELQTRSKMFCSCAVVDPDLAAPNTAVCPVCTGMPGMLPVVNRQAVADGIKVALALGCTIERTSIFARKNYFYPDLPKGYQITQYDHPLARHGHFTVRTASGEHPIRIRRVHLEEDTGKLTHSQGASLVDLNRAGVPLLEIVTEPDLRSPTQARTFASHLRSILRYLGVNSGEMQKGFIRFEANVSVRPRGSTELRTRTEIKNLNSLRALERAICYEIDRQTALQRQGKPVAQQTMGWDEAQQMTVPQRGKEEAQDYRYFPEPDLAPLVIESRWLKEIAANLPELPQARSQRFQRQYSLDQTVAEILTDDPALADYFETAARAGIQATEPVAARTVAHWIQGELFSWMNQHGLTVNELKVSGDQLADLLVAIGSGQLNPSTGKQVLAEMLTTGVPAAQIIQSSGLEQISDRQYLAALVSQVLKDNPEQFAAYQCGKEGLLNWFFGQVMRATAGRADPQIVRAELKRQLKPD